MTSISTNTTPPPDLLPLSGVLPDFANRGFSIPEQVTYQAMWRAVANGRLPAQQVSGRYRVRRSDLPAYAAFLGLVPPAPVKQPRKAAPVSAAA